MVSGYGVDALYVIRLGQGGFHEVSVGVRESPDGRLWQTATIRLTGFENVWSVVKHRPLHEGHVPQQQRARVVEIFREIWIPLPP
ncbi:hypothetical protein WN51_07938 [Melipona quadrifasciata]|uniref:Uncharacterized protein n=1 Tax=Melipona quadrifasciata TaxID=166423 RepID=A0A0N0U2V2_9HYME|nr:hypothetical protein WN51_07938 [Melipona quadrifasciata]